MLLFEIKGRFILGSRSRSKGKDLTISGRPTEHTLEPAPTINKHHVGVHVGLTSLAPDRTCLPEVHNGGIVL